jgi:hypothetical protein
MGNHSGLYRWQWCVRYTAIMWWRTRIPIRSAWCCAIAGWEMNVEHGGSDYGPSDAVYSELSYWTND